MSLLLRTINRSNLWLQTGAYEYVEGSPTVGDCMRLYQRVWMAAELAWRIWTPAWKRTGDDPFENIKLLTAWRVGWGIWGKR